jgi:carboxymethylenebutenolidase
MTGMTTQLTMIETPSGETVPATLAAPPADDPAMGAVIVVHDARGATPYLASVCDRLAEAGLFALAPHLYHWEGFSEVNPAEGWPSAAEDMTRLTVSGLNIDIDGTLLYLREAGFGVGRVAVLGFCMGGTVALHSATRHALGAAVSFYGGGVSTPYWDGVPPLIQLAPTLRTPWLGLYGEEDALISMSEISDLRAAAEGAQAPTTLVTYPGAGHAFHSDDRSNVYRRAAAEDAWKRALDWIENNLAPS